MQVIVALAEKGDMGALQAYTGQTGGQLNYLQVREHYQGFCQHQGVEWTAAQTGVAAISLVLATRWHGGQHQG